MSFVHLHVHSHYSLLQASCTIPALINKCVEYKMPAMALTDYGNMFGAVEFYFSALDKGIKPLLACELYYVEDNTSKNQLENGFRDPSKSHKTLILIAKDLKGYKNLCHISTKAYQEGFYLQPRADYALFEKYKEGLIALTGGGRGRVPWLFHNKSKEESFKEIEILQKIFGSHLYLQLQHPFLENSKKYNVFLAEIAHKKSLPLIMGGDVHYVEKEDFLTQDVLFCIGTNKTLYDKQRSKLGVPEFYFRNSQDMYALLTESFYKQACDNTLEVADQCLVTFKVKDKKGKPIYHLPQLADSKKKLEDLTYKGLEKRFQEANLRQEPILEERKKDYKIRIKYELDIIDKMGFNGYFYIVYDFIYWAKKNHIPVGPGRGSGASSLVSFCLGITDLDPMPLNLIFERFLNPERISMPDFDIDFCQDNRHRVIEYINKKYGLDCSCHVVTYGRLSVRAAIRDVGRVLALGYSEVDRIAKMIPDILGITLKEALKKEARLKQMCEEDPKIKELIDLTGLLEGLIRHLSIHAAGIIIADNPIVNYAPLYKGVEGENVIQYDLKSAEKIGLIKFDFLGLKTLTHIAETLRLIQKTKAKKIQVQQISLNDSGIYEVMCRGDTVGIFQFESKGITDLLIKSQPTCFEDVVALNALYRPGPMNMIPSYLERKKGDVPVEYIFPELEPILKETYGIIVYQEQVQQIAVEIAGYSYGEADVLRRAMGKKIKSVMVEQRNLFLEGAREKGYCLKKSEKLFDLMAEFAKYGFNKSHAAAYCVLAVQTAWLKHYYPIEFLASQMSIDQRDVDKVFKSIEDAKAHGYEITAPHVNSSYEFFSIEEDKINFSLGAIKGIGILAAKEIVRARESLKNKNFSSLEEFFETIDLKKINKKNIEGLIKSGALDHFNYHRREILVNLEKFLHQAEKCIRDRETGQSSLFDKDLRNENQVKLKESSPWSYKTQIQFEKEILGFYLNSHPLKILKGLEKSISFDKISDLNQPGKEFKVLSLVKRFKEIFTKNSEKMAFVLLDDGFSSIEAVLFSDSYERVKDLLNQEGEPLCVKGKLIQKNMSSSYQLVVEDLYLFDDYLKKVKQIDIHLDSSVKKEQISSLEKVISNSSKGNSRVFVKLFTDKGLLVEFDTAKQYDIKINYDFLEKIHALFKSLNSIRLSS
ncbi:MAG: DNA polymerase III subunit alpha [Bdellovibrionales bacterium]|nr:DNA polymerase III subunit alpha [Bdellovibrionales bacterium]